MLSPYRALLAIPGTRGFVIPGVIGRFPLSMLGLGSVLLIKEETGSYGIAGAVTATLAVSTALAGPLIGALADRWGQRRVLLPALAIFAATVTALVVAAISGAPHWALFPPAAVAGATVPQVGSMARRRWTSLVGGTSRFSTALSLESVLDEVVFVIGPVAATALATGVWPAAGVVAALGLAIVGVLFFAAQRSTEPRPRRHVDATDEERHSPSAYRFKGLWVVIVAFLGMGACFGTVDLSIVAFAEDEGHAGMAGVLLATFAFGSLVSGVMYGVINWRAPLHVRYRRSLAALTVSTIPLTFVPSIPVMAVAALLVGVSISPTLVAGMGLVESLVPVGSLTEGFAWAGGAIGMGVALGSGVAGHLIDVYGASSTLRLTTVCAVLAAIVAAAGHRWLVSDRSATPSVEVCEPATP